MSIKLIFQDVRAVYEVVGKREVLEGKSLKNLQIKSSKNLQKCWNLWCSTLKIYVKFIVFFWLIMVSAFCVEIVFDVELKDSNQNLVSSYKNSPDYKVPGNGMVS